MRKGLLFAGGAMVAIVGFLLFRPDTLVTDVRASEPLADAFTSTIEPQVTTATPPPSTTEVTPTPTTTAVQVLPLTTGSFSGIEHRASGTATVYQSGEQFVLRFEDDTDIQNGPDLYVWLLAADSYEGGAPAGYIDLGKLTGNVGGQNYDLPPEFDPSIHRAVLVWCLRFAVPFATAPLS